MRRSIGSPSTATMTSPTRRPARLALTSATLVMTSFCSMKRAAAPMGTAPRYAPSVELPMMTWAS